MFPSAPTHGGQGILRWKPAWNPWKQSFDAIPPGPITAAPNLSSPARGSGFCCCDSHAASINGFAVGKPRGLRVLQLPCGGLAMGWWEERRTAP